MVRESNKTFLTCTTFLIYNVRYVYKYINILNMNAHCNCLFPKLQKINCKCFSLFTHIRDLIRFNCVSITYKYMYVCLKYVLTTIHNSK